MPASRPRYRHATWLACILLLTACNQFPGVLPDNSATEPAPYFRPPAPEVTVTATTAPAAEAQSAPDHSPTNCQNNLAFLQDLTIPDGTSVLPRSTMDKRWEVENTSTCGWNEQYRMRLIAGPAMGAQAEQALYPARSGTRAVLRILFEAPEEPGDYRSAWQAHGPNGEPFGDPFFIDIRVETPLTKAMEGAETQTP